MASLPPPPPGIDLQADKGPHIISSGIALIILPTVFVVLRFISRYLAQAGFWWDDLLVVTSLILSYGPNGCMMDCEFFAESNSQDIALEIDKEAAARTNGFGKHLWSLASPEHNTSQFLKILYVYIIFYYSAVVSIKLSM